jgi:hypothetical protein
MECQRCQKVLTDPRVCYQCGWRQSPQAPELAPAPEEAAVTPEQQPAAVPKSELASEKLPILEKRTAEPPQGDTTPAARKPEATPLKRDTEAERMARRQGAHSKKSPDEQKLQAAVFQGDGGAALPAPPDVTPAETQQPAATPSDEPTPALAPEKKIPEAAPPETTKVPPKAKDAPEPQSEKPAPPHEAPHPPSEQEIRGTRFTQSRLNDYNATAGDHNIINNQYERFHGVETTIAGHHNVVNIGSGRDGSLAFGSKSSIFEILADLPDPKMTDPTAAAFQSEELRAKSETLRRDRLLLISCDQEGFLRAAAGAVIETLGIAKPQRKLLNFRLLPSTGFAPTISDFFHKRTVAENQELLSEDQELLIVIDAAEKGQPFIDSLLTAEGVFDYDSINQKLRSQHLSLICLVDPQRLGKRPETEIEKLSFEVWTLSYWRQRVRQYFPETYVELESKITQQRETRRWARDKADFRQQIDSLLQEERLLDVVDAGGWPLDPIPEESFPGSGQPVHMMVAYVATFFPNLAPNEFSRVVSLLLGNRTHLISVTVEQKENDGTIKAVQVQREKRLADLWNDESDAILRQCRLIRSKETNRTITFADLGCRDRFRRQFEEDYGLYVQSQFLAAYEKGLIFDASDRIAIDMRVLTLDMAASYPDQFGTHWLFDVIAGSSRQLGSPGLQLEAAHVFQRTAELLCELWTHDLAPLVKGVLDQLINAGMHAAAFEILQNLLRTTPGLDALWYIRQVVERGKTGDRDAIYAYLYRELRVSGGPYGVLRALEQWLPPIDRDPEKYSQANSLVLRLLLEYCVDITAHYELRHYGRWPSRFPLLRVNSETKAREEFGLVARWLLHPGLGSVIEDVSSPDRSTRLVSALFCEWAFILLGNPELFGTDSGDDEGKARSAPSPEQVLSAEAAFGILIEQIIARSTASYQRELQRTMLEYWEELKAVLLFVANLPDVTRGQRAEALWKREIVRKLLTQFRRLQRELRPAPPANRASATA